MAFCFLFRTGCLIGLPTVMLGADLSPAVEKPSASFVASQIDQAIAEEVFADNLDLAPRTDDITFLRRVWLDVVGDIPTPEDVIAFVFDPAEDKRERLVQELLDDPHYGQNWARYWRDVVFYRALEDRSRIASGAMEADLKDKLNENVGWDRIASEFITAVGDVQENGSTAIAMAQDGRTEETTAEISRVFLGIQIQCAQCHDHPYDRWKREQFHELAAFFPRIAVRNVRGLTKRSFEVYASDFFRRQNRRNKDNRPKAEHMMPDLDRPDAAGTQMQPKFFLTGATLPEGSYDSDRRSQLAEWLTENQWFAIAAVNRLWSELVGEGFYEPVDDIGPDREATSPTAVKILAEGFRESGCDMKWLLKTICQTEAYQRESRPRRGPEETPMVANVPQLLRSGQLFNSLCSALDIDETSLLANTRRRAAGDRRFGPRRRFDEIFGYDPSISRDTVSASISQKLALMNSEQINRYVAAARTNLLADLLREIEEDEPLVVELYLRCLSREPESGEIELALDYQQEVGDRRQAAEDLLWTLVNSAEFQHRQ